MTDVARPRELKSGDNLPSPPSSPRRTSSTPSRVYSFRFEGSGVPPHSSSSSASASSISSVTMTDVKVRDSPTKTVIHIGRAKSNELKLPKGEYFESPPPRKLSDSLTSSPSRSVGGNSGGNSDSSNNNNNNNTTTTNNNSNNSMNSNLVNSPPKNVTKLSSTSRRNGRRKISRNGRKNNINNRLNNNNNNNTNNENSVSLLSTPPSQSRGFKSRENSQSRSTSTSRQSASASSSPFLNDAKEDTPSRVFPPVPIQTVTFDPPLAPPPVTPRNTKSTASTPIGTPTTATATAATSTTASPSSPASVTLPSAMSYPHPTLRAIHIIVPVNTMASLTATLSSTPRAIQSPATPAPLAATTAAPSTSSSVSTSTPASTPAPSTPASITSPTALSYVSTPPSSPSSIASSMSPASSPNHTRTQTLPTTTTTTAAASIPPGPVRLHFEHSNPLLFANPSLSPRSPADRHLTTPTFINGKSSLGRAYSNPISPLAGTSSSSSSSASSSSIPPTTVPVPVCLFASLRNQMSTISSSFPSSTQPSSPAPSPCSLSSPSASYSAFATLSKQHTPSSLTSPLTRNQFSYGSPSPSSNHLHSPSIPHPCLPLSSSASSPPIPSSRATTSSISTPSLWPFSSNPPSAFAPVPLMRNRSSSPPKQYSSAPKQYTSLSSSLPELLSPRPETSSQQSVSSQRTLFFVPSSSSSASASAALTPTETMQGGGDINNNNNAIGNNNNRNLLFGSLFHTSSSVSSSVRASLSSMSSSAFASPTVSPHSKLSSGSFESATSFQAPAASASSSITTTTTTTFPTTSQSSLVLPSFTNGNVALSPSPPSTATVAPAPPPSSLFPSHVHFRYPTSLTTATLLPESVPTPTASSKLPQVTPTAMTSKPFFPPNISSPPTPLSSSSERGQSRGKLKKTIIGGRNNHKLDLGESSSYTFSSDSRRDSNPEHDGSNEHVTLHLRSTSNTSPRSLSSMSTFSRFMLLQQATKTTPSPTGVRSRSLSPASRNLSSSSQLENTMPSPNHFEPNNIQPIDVTEPWPLGPGLTFPAPSPGGLLSPDQGETSSPLKEGGNGGSNGSNTSDGGSGNGSVSGSTEFEKLKLELPKLSGRQYSLTSEQGKTLISPRQAGSSRGESRPRSLPWDTNDPLICQGYLKMVPHGMFCKFRQSKRKYCALDIRLRCFFYWKNIEQRDTGRAKCLSLVVGGNASNESIEMSYAGGASTAILKCESPEDAQRWLNALDLLKTGRERSVSRTSSKFVPSLMDSKSINTATYSSPPSRDWTSPEKTTEDTFSHTETIRNTFAAEYQKQQHVVKPISKKPSVTPPPPPGLNPALTIRGNLR